MVAFKIDILSELKKKGFRTTELINKKVVTSQTLQNIRNGQTNLSMKTINNICICLGCQISDILEIIPTDDDIEQFF